MERTISAEIDKDKFSSNSQFSFSVRHFDDKVVAFKPFTSDSSIAYNITEPGFYNIQAYIKDEDNLKLINFKHKYFPPLDSLNVDSKNSREDFEVSIAKAHKKNSITPYAIQYNGQHFDFIFFPSPERNLYVLCPSAIIRGEFPVPYFYRWQWANQGKFPGNVIVVSDPTFELDPELGAGWFIGDRENDATANFCDILRIFCKVLQIPYRNIAFWGSSAGGFIAIQMSRHFQGSAAVAVNCQTDINRYGGHEKLYETAFPGISANAINSCYSERLSLLQVLDSLSKNRILMVQNILDKHHYEEHFKPFVHKATGKRVEDLNQGIWRLEKSPFTFWVYSHPDGHMAETPEMAEAIIRMIQAGKL